MTRSPTGRGTGAHPEDWDPEEFLSGLNTRVDAFERTAVHATSARSWIPRAIAAGLVCAMAGGAAWVARHPGPSADARRGGREYATAAGQRSQITLADGTRITLAPASRLRVGPAYGQGRREVSVDGEAYFAVVHDAAHPFAVRVRRATVTDIGTAFDVRAYAEDAKVRVAVAEGEVVVGRVGDERVGDGRVGNPSLRARDLADITDSTIVVTHSANVALLTSWQQGGLAFDNTPIRQVVQDLGRAFDLDITVADSALLAHRITSSFSHESADDVLNAIAFSIGATFTHVGRHVVIRSQASAARRGPPPHAAPGLVLSARPVVSSPSTP